MPPAIPPPPKSHSKGDEYVIVPPDGGWGWVVVFAAFYCQTVLDGVQLSFGMILAEIAHEYYHDEDHYSSVSLIGSLMYGAHFLAGPLCAGLSYYFGERLVSIVGSLIAAIALGSAYFKPPIPVFYFLGFSAGVGLCFVNMSSIVITTLYFSQKRVLALGIVVCGTGAGTIIFTALSSFTLKNTTWETFALIEAALTLSMAFAAFTFRPLVPTLVQTKERTTTKIEKKIVDTSEHHPGRATLYYVRGDILRNSATSVSSNSPSVSSFKEHTDETLEQLAAAMTLLHVREKGFGGWSWRCDCCGKKEPRMSAVITMEPAIRQSLLEEDPSHTVVKMAVEDDENPPIEKNTLRTTLHHLCAPMTDFSLLMSPKFLAYCAGGALSGSALIIVIFYEKLRYIKQGGTEEETMYYMIGLGCFNMFWRLFLGGLSLFSWVNYHSLNWSGMLLGGLFTMASGLYHNVYYEYLCGCLYSLAIACFAVFYPVILVELVGLEKVSSVTGITMLFMGICSISGAPLSGYVYELTNDIEMIFYIGGGMFAIAGFIFLLIPTHHKHNHDNLNR